MYDMLYTHKKKSENKINIFEIDLNGDIMMVNDTNSWIFFIAKIAFVRRTNNHHFHYHDDVHMIKLAHFMI